jgi:polyribonucleotide 5'-hydroxyl-kinase
MPDFVKVVWLPKSGGVVERPAEQRIAAREARIKEYFYGPKLNLFPHTIEVRSSKSLIVKRKTISKVTSRELDIKL